MALPANSILREMPIGIPANIRRLMAGLGYAFDAAGLAFDRLHETARAFYLPGDGKAERLARFTPNRRLALIADAWSVVDNLARLRAIAGEFPVGNPAPVELTTYLSASDEVRLMRNRGQHLNQDYAKDMHFEGDNPVFGAVTWIDPRYPGGDIRTGVISGPMINPKGNANLLKIRMSSAESDDVCNFELLAFDRQINLDASYMDAEQFLAAFENTLQRNIYKQLRDGAAEQNAPLEPLLEVRPCDVVISLAFLANSTGWDMVAEDSIAQTEIPPR
jgi:hypothetical protein